MKKIEYCMIKRLLRISSQFLFSLSLELSLYSLSHNLACLEFYQSTLEALQHTLDLEKEGKGRARKCKGTLGSPTTMGFSCRYQVACMVSLLVLTYMPYACGYLVMICHWHGGLLLDSHGVVHFTFCFLADAHVPYGCGLSYQFLEPLLEKRFGSPVTTWAELLVLETLIGQVTM